MKKICLAVTGLHGAGKTMFISSLAYNLLQGGQMLPNVFSRHPFRAFLATGNERPFPLYANLQKLQSRPAQWPPATEELSTLNLLLRFEPQTGLSRFIHKSGQHGEALINKHYTREIKLIDYPGEWLLDIPLAQGKISYETWSAQCLTLANTPPRFQAASAWLHHIQCYCRAEMPAREDAIHTAAMLYTEYLRQCRDEYGLSMLQPGHFLQPGALERNLLVFCPLPVPDHAKVIKNSMYELMRQRFYHFCAAIKAEDMGWIRQIDAQIILVDLPTLLYRGQDAFEDAEKAMRAVAQNFHYGHSWWPFPRRIQRLVYCASKADCFLEADYLNVKSILQNMLQGNASAVRKGIPLSYELLSALRCTTEKQAKGCTVMLAPGYKDKNGKAMLWDVGRIAHHYPPQWDSMDYGLPQASIPPPDGDYQQGLPNINIAQIINLLCKDLLP